MNRASASNAFNAASMLAASLCAGTRIANRVDGSPRVAERRCGSSPAALITSRYAAGAATTAAEPSTAAEAAAFIEREKR